MTDYKEIAISYREGNLGDNERVIRWYREIFVPEQMEFKRADRGNVDKLMILENDMLRLDIKEIINNYIDVMKQWYMVNDIAYNKSDLIEEDTED